MIQTTEKIEVMDAFKGGSEARRLFLGEIPSGSRDVVIVQHILRISPRPLPGA